jgi:hypothetical protein
LKPPSSKNMIVYRVRIPKDKAYLALKKTLDEIQSKPSDMTLLNFIGLLCNAEIQEMVRERSSRYPFSIGVLVDSLFAALGPEDDTWGKGRTIDECKLVLERALIICIKKSSKTR